MPLRASQQDGIKRIMLRVDMNGEMQASTKGATAPWLHGILHEISPFGTGFIEDTESGQIYGFYKAALAKAVPMDRLEGAQVRFQLDAAGVVLSVDPILSA